ncbi:hypothetical protein SCOCK_220136 [Actinacidiphila cocklensis]|uniref:Uncharacterized protein n=1 Tax=Actinacidiphila cocklensis TaxID=887465 RepID=A0A9W4DTV8_9ACTN|nr:hypothetical protein SCOCK_220136 [Actinacidiphila cocklensis]
MARDRPPGHRRRGRHAGVTGGDRRLFPQPSLRLADRRMGERAVQRGRLAGGTGGAVRGAGGALAGGHRGARTPVLGRLPGGCGERRILAGPGEPAARPAAVRPRGGRLVGGAAGAVAGRTRYPKGVAHCRGSGVHERERPAGCSPEPCGSEHRPDKSDEPAGRVNCVGLARIAHAQCAELARSHLTCPTATHASDHLPSCVPQQ